MKTKETIGKQDHPASATKLKNDKQKVPVHFVFSLIAGTVAGMAIIFIILWGAKLLFKL